MKQIVFNQLRKHEGFKSKPYRCTAGKLTIGYGRNLDDVGIKQTEASSMLWNDIADAEETAEKLFKNFKKLSDNRQAVLVNMAFNLGMERLAGFRKFRQAVEERRYDDAAVEMLDSLWARQVKGRAVELADLMKRG